MNKKTADELLTNLKIENYDLNVPESELKKLEINKLIDYYKNVIAALKKEIEKLKYNYNTIWKDNLECGKQIDKLKDTCYYNAGLYNNLKQKYENLQEEYNLLSTPDRLRRKIKMVKRQNNTQAKELDEIKKQTRYIKKGFKIAVLKP